MKRVLFGALMLLVACGTEGDVAVQPEEGDVEPRKVFYGTFADADTDSESRTYIDSSVNLRWTSGDKVSIFTETSRNKWSEFLGDTGDTAGEFSEPKASGFGTGTDINANYSIYPYASTNKLDAYTGVFTYTMPDSQGYVEDSFGAGANVMTAVTADADDYDLVFRNVCGYIHFRLYGTDVTLKSLVLTATAGEALNGTCDITHVYGGTPSIAFTSGTSNSVTIECGKGVTLGTTAESATDFWFVLPPVTMSGGFSIVANGYYGGTWSKSTSANIVISRNQYRNVGAMEVTIASSGTGMGVDGWESGGDYEGSAE